MIHMFKFGSGSRWKQLNRFRLLSFTLNHDIFFVWLFQEWA